MADKPDDARARAEARFRKQEATNRENEKVWAEHAAAAQAADQKRAKLKSLRLAKEAADREAQAEIDASKTPAKKSSKRSRAR
ncbi:MAG TPA: hypothetical protein VH743_10960 [Beijerinckiaceae bacterium]|jgi:hypothetical protein